MRTFNVAGPCFAADHYVIPPERRVPDVRRLVEGKAYFDLHAPRQVGKTTALLALADSLTREGRFAAILLSCERGRAFDDPARAEDAILRGWKNDVPARLPPELGLPPEPERGHKTLDDALTAWARACPRPLVVFLDEIDSLPSAALLAVLSELRAGHARRPAHFPASIALVGVRDVRDYKLASGGSENLRTSSPFNVKAESLTMRGFTEAEVGELYAQHTAETGQRFEPDAIEHAYELTRGQPWLVNALARECVEKIVVDRAVPVARADVAEAKRRLVERQDTHLDSLLDRLREPRVRAVVEPILAGGAAEDLPADDVRFVEDLGLVALGPTGGLVVANPIYEEVIPTALSYVTRAYLPASAPVWLDARGRLHAGALLDAFVAFWREHGEALMGTSPYPEIAPHLVLLAFMHRVVNAKGTVAREYAIGRDRMDVLVSLPPDRVAMELKVWRKGRPDPRTKGLEQLDGYLAGLGLHTGWLVVFDARPDRARVEERTRTEEATSPTGRLVTVVRA